MRTFLGTVLGIIALGVLLIAYGLLSPRVGATAMAAGIADASANFYPAARPTFATERVNLPEESNIAATPLLQIRCEPGQRAAIRQVAGATVAECLGAVSADGYASVSTPVNYQVRPVPVSQTYPEPRRSTTARARQSGRDWTKTALVIGGTTGAGAGIGAIFGGKKGALIGAAIGGGASSLYEARKR